MGCTKRHTSECGRVCAICHVAASGSVVNVRVHMPKHCPVTFVLVHGITGLLMCALSSHPIIQLANNIP